MSIQKRKRGFIFRGLDSWRNRFNFHSAAAGRLYFKRQTALSDVARLFLNPSASTDLISLFFWLHKLLNLTFPPKASLTAYREFVCSNTYLNSCTKHTTVSRGSWHWHQRRDVFTAVSRQPSLWSFTIAGTDRSPIVRGVALRKPIFGMVSDKRCSSSRRTASLRVCLQAR